jgi:uncharacterized protein (DUF885 family)
LSSEQAITASVLEFVLNEGFYESFSGTAGHHFLDRPFPLTHLEGPHDTLVSLLARDQVIEDTSDADAYLARIEKADGMFEGVRKAMQSRAGLGVFAPVSSLEKAIGDISRFSSGQAENNILVQSLAAKLKGKLPTQTVDRYRSAASELVARKVQPGCAGLVAEANDQLKNGQSNFGAWSLPDGDAWYQWQLRGHTTTALKAEEIHELGLEGIRDLHDRIRSEFSALGIEGETIASLYQQADENIKTDVAVDRSREQILRDARDIVARRKTDIRSMFDLWPHKDVTLEAVPDVMEQSHHSYYIPPSLDGKRAGKFVLNLRQLQMMSEAELSTLCHHETYPGHHLQLTVAQELEHLPLFRRAMLFAAYLEGWAKYSEWLPIEEALVKDPMVALGRLRGELYSTTNLALDTGIHSLRWSREKAVEFMRVSTGAGVDFAEVIVDRCSVTPGQLCAYKTGMIAVMGIHDDYRKASGAAFSRPAFHNAMLRHGALPLDLFQELAQSELQIRPKS